MNELEEFLHFTAKFLRLNKNCNLAPIVFHDSQIIINPDGVKPSAIIRDQQEYIELLKEYRAAFLNDTTRYTRGKNYHHNLHFLLKNATFHDLNNLNLFLKRRIAYFEDTSFESYQTPKLLTEILDYPFFAWRTDCFLGCETPREMRFYTESDEKQIAFPSVRYGIYQNQVFVYCIQNETPNPVFYKRFDSLNQFTSSMKRRGSLPISFLMSIILFLKTCFEEGYTDFLFVDILPLRYYEFYHRAYAEEQMDYLQWKITNQLIMTLLRICEECPNIKLISYPDLDGHTRLKYTEGYQDIKNPYFQEILSKTLRRK